MCVKQCAEWFYWVCSSQSRQHTTFYIFFNYSPTPARIPIPISNSYNFLVLFFSSIKHHFPKRQCSQQSFKSPFPGEMRVIFSADKKVFKSDMTFSPQLLNAIIRLLFIRGRSQHKMAGLTGSSISQVLTHGMHRVTLILILQPICVHFSWNPKRKALGAEVRKFEQRFEETFLQLHICLANTSESDAHPWKASVHLIPRDVSLRLINKVGLARAKFKILYFLFFFLSLE